MGSGEGRSISWEISLVRMALRSWGGLKNHLIPRISWILGRSLSRQTLQDHPRLERTQIEWKKWKRSPDSECFFCNAIFGTDIMFSGSWSPFWATSHLVFFFWTSRTRLLETNDPPFDHLRFTTCYTFMNIHIRERIIYFNMHMFINSGGIPEITSSSRISETEWKMSRKSNHVREWKSC